MTVSDSETGTAPAAGAGVQAAAAAGVDPVAAAEVEAAVTAGLRDTPGGGVDAVVTGAASGIGAACARRLVAEGLRVLAVDKNPAGLDALAADGAVPLVADLGQESERDRVVAAAPGARYLVNAAGIIRFRPILESGVADMREIYPVNVEAVWDLTSRLGRDMPPGGAIVNLSSASAKLSATVECAVYASSKAAVLSITRSFAYAFTGRGVRVNAVVPGIIDTPMGEVVIDSLAQLRGMTRGQAQEMRFNSIPLGRFGTPEDCANVIWFLLSDQAGFMTGQAVNITGGQIMF
jgi:NAD(P)-dependent dehydrogenase (short-subunit alcohol dehydrogenase family)